MRTPASVSGPHCRRRSRSARSASRPTRASTPPTVGAVERLRNAGVVPGAPARGRSSCRRYRPLVGEGPTARDCEVASSSCRTKVLSQLPINRIPSRSTMTTVGRYPPRALFASRVPRNLSSPRLPVRMTLAGIGQGMQGTVRVARTKIRRDQTLTVIEPRSRGRNVHLPYQESRSQVERVVAAAVIWGPEKLCAASHVLVIGLYRSHHREVWPILLTSTPADCACAVVGTARPPESRDQRRYGGERAGGVDEAAPRALARRAKPAGRLAADAV